MTDATGHCAVTVSRTTPGRAAITATFSTLNPVATAVAEVTFEGTIREALANGADHVVTIEVSGGDLTLTIDTDPPITNPLSAITSISITGGNQANTLVGPDTDNVWTVTAPNGGTLAIKDGPNVTFSVPGGHLSLTGGTGVDRFVLAGGSVDGTINGGTGAAVDTLEAPAASSAWAISGAKAGTLDTRAFADIENVSLAFTDAAEHVRVTQDATGALVVEPAAVGGFAKATITITGAASPDVTVDLGGGDDTAFVDAIVTLVPNLRILGGAGNDYVITAVRSSFAPKLFVEGGTGADVLEDYAGIASANLGNVEVLPAGIPSFTEEGPGPVTDSRALLNLRDKFPATAAINGIAVQPGEQVIFAATVNGGVWRSVDAGSTWEPLTDQLPSLAIGAIALAPKDADGNNVLATTPLDKLVVFAGTGSFSSFGGRGGFSVGIYKSSDGGETWSLLAPEPLANVSITSVVAASDTTVLVAAMGMGPVATTGGIAFDATAAAVQAALERLPNIGAGNVSVTEAARIYTVTFRGLLAKRDVPQLVSNSRADPDRDDDPRGRRHDERGPDDLAGRHHGGGYTLTFGDWAGGVFRSTDGGTNFTRVLAGTATDLVVDPGLPGRFYAGIAYDGVYRSDNGGVNWKKFDVGDYLATDNADNDGNLRVDDPAERISGVVRIRLAVRASAAPAANDPNPVYAALLGIASRG